MTSHVSVNIAMLLQADEPNYFAAVPALAERLGVKPIDNVYTGAFVLKVKDGRMYDVFALVHAFLDRLDRLEGISQ